MKPSITRLMLALILVLLLVSGPFLPTSVTDLITYSVCYGIVVLGMLLLIKTGLVSFGHGLYFCLGAYAAGLLENLFGISEISLMILASILTTGFIAAMVGLLLKKYRGIFFAMLSLALSMLLYALLAETPELGSTDGFNVSPKTLFGLNINDSEYTRYMIFTTTIVVAWTCANSVLIYLDTSMGKLSEAIKDNELRVEYLGASVENTIYVNYVVSAILAGLGGSLMALTVGHIDPELSYWTTSGEFVFISIMAGTGNVLAPFLGALIFEIVRSFAYEYSPNTWQMALGTTMLMIIIFLPGGIWSIFEKFNKDKP